MEQLLLLLQRFECEVAALGTALLTPFLEDAGVVFRSSHGSLPTFYAEMFGTSSVPMPATLLVIGEGHTAGVSLKPFAFPEIVGRRLLAASEADRNAVEALAAGRAVETLWCREPGFPPNVDLRPDQGTDVATETAWMAERWSSWRRSFLLGDPELVGRWIPAASRNHWAPIHGRPQSAVVRLLEEPLARVSTVFGRQQDDRDFLALSRLGTAFQLIDPGRPPFPVLSEAPLRWPAPVGAPDESDEPDDDQLEAWARERRVVSTLLFWTGMARELESIYALVEVLGLTGLRSGLVLTTESVAGMSWPPLTLTRTPRDRGGLGSRVELLLASAGTGAMIESVAPLARFATALCQAVEQLGAILGSETLPRGWWPVMDAQLLPNPLRRVTTDSVTPYVHVHYRPRPLGSSPAGSSQRGRHRSLRGTVRESPLRHFFEPLRPFSAYRPGPPGRGVLTAVRQAGFEYAFTTSAFSGSARVVVDVPGLTALTYTAGRWDGWTPFITVGGIADLHRAERRLLRSGQPGWLAGTVDACLWAFSGPVWQRGTRLFEMCRWLASGGSSGRLINVTPRTAARYARVLADSARVETLRSR